MSEIKILRCVNQGSNWHTVIDCDILVHVNPSGRWRAGRLAGIGRIWGVTGMPGIVGIAGGHGDSQGWSVVHGVIPCVSTMY